MIARTVFHASSDDYLPGSTVFWGISRTQPYCPATWTGDAVRAFETMDGTHSTPGATAWPSGEAGERARGAVVAADWRPIDHAVSSAQAEKKGALPFAAKRKARRS
jgi:hypothetical protein